MPSLIAAAVVGGAGISAAAGLSAAGSASKAQTTSADKANATQLAMYDRTRGDLLPYNDIGRQAFSTLGERLNKLSQPFDMTQENLEKTPGYQFNLSQGLKGISNMANARGFSGAALKEAGRFTTGLADNTYQNQFSNYWNNNQNAYNMLSGVSQIGENAAAQTGSYGTQTAANVGNNMIGAGNAQGAAAIAGGNAISNAANSVGSYYGLKSLVGNSGGGGGIYNSSAVPIYGSGGFWGAPQ